MSDEPFIFHPSAFTNFLTSRRNGSGGKKFERMVRLRVRIRFSKQDDLRWIGHRDLMRCFERIFRRAELPLGRSEGFHPKPRMTFPLPLAVGIAGADEVMEFELAETLTAEEIQSRLAPQLPGGLDAAFGRSAPSRRQKSRSPQRLLRGPDPRAACKPAWRNGSIACWPSRPARSPAPTAVRPSISARFWNRSRFPTGVLSMRLRIDQAGSAGPREVLKALGLDDLESQGVALARTAVEIAAVKRR